PRDRDPARAGARAHRSERRARGRRRAASAVGGAEPAHAGIAAARDRTRRPYVQPRFAQAGLRPAVRRAQAAGTGEDADRPAERERGGAGGDRRAARTAARDPRLPRPRQAAQHLHRQAARDDPPGQRPRAHQLPPGRRGDRAARVLRSEPAEHPDPHRGRPPHPHRVRRAAGTQDRRLRLLADRAAHHGAPVRGPGAAARVHVRHRRAHRDRGRGVRQDGRDGGGRRAPRREGDQLRPDVRHERVRAGDAAGDLARRGAGLHRAVLRPLPGRARVHGAHAPAGARPGLCRDRVRPAPVPGEHPRAQPGPALGRRTRGDQRADAGHRRRHHQARDGRRGRLARRAPRTRADGAAGARRTGVRGRHRLRRHADRGGDRAHGPGRATAGSAGGRQRCRRQ
ncbi:MAG: DNA polymerase I, partial [uncultured Lysobacter sp.]